MWCRRTNVGDNFPWRLNHFSNNDLGVDEFAGLKVGPRYLIRTSSLVIEGDIPLNLLRCSSFVSSGRPMDLGNVCCL